MGKTVVTVDLNPLSRTARKATITIVDNIIRVIPLLISEIESLRGSGSDDLEGILSAFDNQDNLKSVLEFISRRLNAFSFEGE
jgi:4-phosphopantoate--beta-alanine ligase